MEGYKSKYTGQQVENILDNGVQKSDLYKYATKAEVYSSINAALGSIPTPDVSGQINAHNGDAGAHPYIQGKVAEIGELANNKAGAFYVEPDTGLFVIFRDEESKKSYIEDGDESGVIDKFALGGAESETVYMMTVNTPKDTYSFTSSSEKMEITAGFTSQVKYTDEEGYIEFKESALFSVSVIKSGSESVVVSSGNIVKQGGAFTFDVKPYVGNGENTVIITAVGLVSSSRGVTAVTVGVTSMALLPMSFKWNLPFIEGQNYMLGGMKILGTLDKRLHINVSGNGYNKKYEVPIGTAQYDDVAYNFDGMKHPSETGVYKVELWIEAVDSGITTEVLTYNIMCVSAEDSATAQLICMNDVTTEALNYSESKLFSYAVYNGGVSTATPSFTIKKDADIIADSEQTVNTSVIHEYSYSFMLPFPEDATQINVLAKFGNEQIAIITLKNDVTLAPVDGYSFYMDAATRTNGDGSREYFINEVNQGRVSASWKDMAWVNGMDGWTTDESGNKCLLIPALSNAVVNITPMKNVSTVTIEMLYKVSNVSDFSEDIITILKDTTESWIGMRIKPTNITLHSQALFAEDVKQGYNTRDEEIVHLVVTIVSNYAGIGNVAMIYVNGVKKCSFEWANGDTFANDGVLKLGSTTADLYLYKMRIYGFAFSWQQARQNYIASIMDMVQKTNIKKKEDSVLNDANEIDYDKIYGVYNTMVVELPKGASLPNRKNNPSNEAIKGTNLYINIIQDPTCSIQGDWLNIPLEGQGTTAMTYYRWNLRSKTSDEYGKFRITAKKNVASSMHSHKRGATALYNDLNRAIVGANEADGRVAIYQYPVYGFQKIENEDKPGTYYYQFIGLYTVGPDKGDKSTFGYGNKAYKNTLIHMEGTDHSPRGVGMEYPWEQMVVGLNEDGDAFLGSKNADGSMNEGAWEIGACGDKEEPADMKAYLDIEFAPAYILDYECTPMIVGLPSSTSIDDVNANIREFRSQTADNGFTYADCHIYIDGEYDIYYFNINSQTYVKDGRKVYKGLDKYGFSLSVLNSKASVLAKTKYIRQYRMARHKAEVGNYWLLDDSLFHACFVDLIGATDNEKKNSYPYKFGTLASGSRWRWRQDDLDTIFDVNNQGGADKKYSIMNTDSHNGDMIYKGNTSYHWRCIREYYKDEYKAMMKRIMAKMVELCPVDYGSSQIQKLVGCIRHYFWDYAQEYFTGGAYNIDAKWTYEDTWAIYQSDKSVNAVHPLQQSLGSHYEAEVAWVTLRMLFLASMNEFGAFVDYVDSSEGQVSFRQGGDFTFSLTPAIDMRPAVIQGKNSKKIHAEGRVIAGDSVDISMPTDTSADTMVYIQGADWMSDIGDFSKVQIGSSDKTFSVSSKRVQKIKVGDVNADEVTTNIGKLDVGFCPSVVEVEARNVTSLTGNVDLSKLPRLRRAYFGNTNATAITLPDGSKVQEYDLPSSLIRLSLRKLPLLTPDGLTYDTLNAMTYLWVEDNAKIEGYDLMKSALEGGSPLTNIRVIGFDKTGDATDVDTLKTLANGNYHGIGADGNNDNTSYPIIEGSLHITGSASGKDRDLFKVAFPNLIFSADKFVNFIEFADPEVLRVLLANGVDTDGSRGITEEEAAAVTSIGIWFKDNSIIKSFNELNKFENVTILATNAFRKCSALQSVNLENIAEIGSGCFFESGYSGDVYAPKVIKLKNKAFKNTKITSLNAPLLETLETGFFEDYAIQGPICSCSELTTVNMPNIINIGSNSVRDCPILESVNMQGVKTIGEGAFANDVSLKGINIPLVTSIKTGAFSKCSALTGHISLPNLITLGGKAFRYTNILSFEAPLVTAINGNSPWEGYDMGTFKGCTSLKDVNLPSVVSLGPNEFNGCEQLENITLDWNNITEIGQGVFANCISLSFEELNLPNLETLGQNAFYGVKIKKISNLGKITVLPNTDNGNYKNYGDTSILEEIAIPETVTTIPVGSFYGYSALKKVSFASIVSLSENAFRNCTSLNEMDFDKIGSIGSTCFSGCLNLPTILTFSNLTGSISASAFAGNTKLKEIHAPLCTSVGSSAFNGCNQLEYAELSSVQTISAAAFNRCSKLKIVKFRDIQSFTGDVFFACSGLESVIIDNITPPSLSSNAFTTASSTFIIYVPDASVTAYREASGWNQYADRIKPLSEYLNLKIEVLNGVVSQTNQLVCKYKGQEVTPLWSVVSDVATISESGILTFSNYGEAVVTATYNEESVSVTYEFISEVDLTSAMEINKAYKTDYSVGGTFTYTLVDSQHTQGWKTIITDISDRNGIILTGQGGSSPRLYCYIDDSDKVLEVASASRVAQNEKFPKPSGAVKVIVSFNPAMTNQQLIVY